MIQLIKLQDKFILVSNEEIKEYDKVYDIIDNRIDIATDRTNYHRDKFNKVISENPDFSLLSEEDCKTIGLSTIDLTKLCYHDKRNPDYIDSLENSDDVYEGGIGVDANTKSCFCDNCFYGRTKLTEQLIIAQSLTDKMFSLEDVENAFKSGQLDKSNNWYGGDFKNYAQSLQQTIWDVEVEMEEYIEEETGSELKWMNKRPKITNNSIKVIKLL